MANTRHQGAQIALARVQQLRHDGQVDTIMHDVGSECVLLHNDVMQVDMNDAHAVYVASLCFEPAFMAQLARKLNSVSTLMYIATLQPFTRADLNAFALQSVTELPMTWGNANVYLYKRKTQTL